MQESRFHGSFCKLVTLRVTFSKKQKLVFRYSLEECVYETSGLYSFNFGQEMWHRSHHRLRSTRGFEKLKIGAVIQKQTAELFNKQPV